MRVGPGLGAGIAHQRGDAQAELQRRQIAVQVPAERLELVDALANPVQRLAPEQLNIGIGTKIKVLERIAYDGSLTVSMKRGQQFSVSKKFADNVLVTMA